MKENLCELCKDLIENKRRNRNEKPHKNLKAINSESIKNIGQPRYTNTTYQCIDCNSKIAHNDDRNDSIHWFLIEE